MLTITKEQSVMGVLDLHPEKELYMKKNIGGTDQKIRLAGAILLVALIMLEIIPGGAFAIVGWLLSAALMVTSFTSFSPLYSTFGLNSCHDDKAF